MVKRKVTYYQLLGINPQVSSIEIKKAYRKLVKNHHPDVDYSENDLKQRRQANEFMFKLNEAYAILSDKSKRAAYDALIGIGRPVLPRKGIVLEPVAEEAARERYLRKIFHPSRQDIVRILNKYKQQLINLSLDIYDDVLVTAFEDYIDDVEATLMRVSHSLSSEKNPQSLGAAVQMMRYCIAQAADGLDEMKHFCKNYDYNHLTMAENLFRIAHDLLRKSLQLSKC